MNALTIFVAISPTTPSNGNISVHIYKATVIGINPIGLLNALKISSSTLDSVFSASRLKEFMMTDMIKPLKRSEAKITNNEEIIAPRLIPKNPLPHTSVKRSIKFSIVKYVWLMF